MMNNLKYKKGDRVKVIAEPFEKFFGERNEWIVDRLNPACTYNLYVCYNAFKKNGIAFQFLEKELELVEN